MVYFFHGDDSYSLLKAVEDLKNQLTAEDGQLLAEDVEFSPDFTDQTFSKRLQELLTSQGLFSTKRLVILWDIVNGLNKFAQSEKYLLDTLPNVSKTTTVLFAQRESPDKRLRLYKKLLNLATAREFAVPQGKALENWIESLLQRDGFRIKAAALAHFLSLLGENYDLWQVENELQKLMLWRGREKVIEVSDVAQITATNTAATVFDLANFLAEGRIREAVLLLEQILQAASLADSKSGILKIIGALASQIRSLLLVKALEGESSAAIAKTLGWKEGRVWINQKLGKKYSKEKLIQLLSDLRAIDARLKISEEPPKLLLTLFFEKMKAT